jgi:hypothetical protein
MPTAHQLPDQAAGATVLAVLLFLAFVVGMVIILVGL